MTDAELEKYMQAAMERVAKDKYLFARLQDGQRRSFSSIPQNKFGNVLTALYLLMPPDMNNEALKNAFLIVLTDMTMWKPEAWEYARSWATEVGKRATPEQKERIILEIKHLEDYPMDDTMVERFGVFLQRLAKYEIPMNPKHLLIDMAHWKDDREKVIRNWIFEIGA